MYPISKSNMNIPNKAYLAMHYITRITIITTWFESARNMHNHFGFAHLMTRTSHYYLIAIYITYPVD